jgi:hypothetical protein
MVQAEHRCIGRAGGNAVQVRVGPGTCIFAVLLICGACASPERNEVQPVNRYSDAVAVDGNPAPSASTPQTPGERLRQLVEQSRNDLASKLGVEPSAITVAEARHVIWPDGSAGCAEPGYEYMQMLTEGVLIRLKADGRIFQYHAGAAGPAVHCAKPSPIDPPSKFEER